MGGNVACQRIQYKIVAVKNQIWNIQNREEEITNEESMKEKNMKNVDNSVMASTITATSLKSEKADIHSFIH
eukprot:5385614-Ditylum_brightwellii.AAC.1